MLGLTLILEMCCQERGRCMQAHKVHKVVGNVSTMLIGFFVFLCFVVLFCFFTLFIFGGYSSMEMVESEIITFLKLCLIF